MVGTESMNWKWCGGKPNFKIISWYLSGGTEKNSENLRTVSVLAQIHTEEFLNTSQEHWTDLLRCLSIALHVSLSAADDTVVPLREMLPDRTRDSLVHTSLRSSTNMFLVVGLSKRVRASVSLATPPSVPEHSTTIPDSSREMVKSIWRKQWQL
jgi:hypothetical protein